MTTYVLVHGGWQGAWCWYRVAPLLERRGHRVLTPDLPGHGLDRTSIGELSLQAYADRIGRTLDEAAEPVVLLGHSLGGMVIAQAAADRPERVALLVYLAAFLPGDGDSLASLAQGDTESLLSPSSVPTADGTAITLRDAGLQPALYADCSAEDLALVRRLIQPEPLAPLAQPLRAPGGPGGPLQRIPRAYVECLEDRALPLARQRLMQAARPCRSSVSLPSGHSPFFSMPERLVECLAHL